jgi:hypothetical protein
LIENLGAQNFIEPSAFTPATRVQPVAAVVDQVQIATIPLTAQVQQLGNDTPPSFHAVLDHAIRQLRAAAGQSTNAVEAAYLSGLADRFQELEEAGAGATESPAQSLSRSAAS